MQTGKIESGDHMLAVGCFDFDGGFGRGDIMGVELQPDDGSSETTFPLIVNGLGAFGEGLYPFIVLR